MITAPVLSSTDSSNAHNAASDVLMASADDAIASTTSETAPPRRALSWRPRENATQLANMQADLVPAPGISFFRGVSKVRDANLQYSVHVCARTREVGRRLLRWRSRW